MVRRYVAEPWHPEWPVVPYEMERATDQGPNQWREIAPSEWRYFGIEAGPESTLVNELELAGELLGSDLLHVGVTVGNMTGGHTASWVGQGTPGSRYARARDGVLTRDEIDRVVETQRKLAAHDNAQVNLRRALSEMRELRHMEPQSKLRFLGYFAVLESILTHNPKPSDPYDTITRQVIAKVTLVANQTGFAPVYAAYFGSATADTVWKAMYAYRSAIAHGASFDFTGKGQILRDHHHAQAFLIKAITSVLQLGLRDAVLLRDLKDC